MSDDVGFSISQFRDAWRLLCGASPGYVADGNGAVEYICSDLPISARMGYEPVASHTAFIEKRYLEGH